MNDAVLSTDCQASLENVNMLTVFCDLVELSDGANSVLCDWYEKDLFGFIPLLNFRIISVWCILCNCN